MDFSAIRPSIFVGGTDITLPAIGVLGVGAAYLVFRRGGAPTIQDLFEKHAWKVAILIAAVMTPVAFLVLPIATAKEVVAATMLVVMTLCIVRAMFFPEKRFF